MVQRNRNKMRIFNPLDDRETRMWKSPIPTIDNISATQLSKAEAFARRYSTFLDLSRISTDVVQEVEQQFEESAKEDDSIHINEDHTAFALIRQGRKPLLEGMRLFYAHTDAPCLRLKVNPIQQNWAFEYQNIFNGVRLDTHPYGGINFHQWSGLSLLLKGWAVRDGEMYPVSLPVYSPEIHAHTDPRFIENPGFNEAHPGEELDLDTGFRSIDELIKYFDFKTEEDFARSRIYAVPDTESRFIGPHLLASYGHDARAGIFTTVQAFLNTTAQPEQTLMVFGFDREETGYKGPGGADDVFFEEVLHQYLMDSGEIRSLSELTDPMKLQMYRASLGVNADVTTGGTSKEVDDTRSDYRNMGKLGYGVCLDCTDDISDGAQISPILVDTLQRSLGLGDVIFQVTGTATTVDAGNYIGGLDTFSYRRGMPQVNLSIPVGSLHSPQELAHVGDIFQAFRAYRSLMSDRTVL